MGYYVNPEGESKETWLDRNGTVEMYTPKTMPTDNSVYVCLVDNGPFTAGGIAYSQQELEAFQHPGDYRPKTWYKVPVDKIKELPGMATLFNKISL